MLLVVVNASMDRHSEHGPIILNAAPVILNLIQNLNPRQLQQTPHSDGSRFCAIVKREQ